MNSFSFRLFYLFGEGGGITEITKPDIESIIEIFIEHIDTSDGVDRI